MERPGMWLSSACFTAAGDGFGRPPPRVGFERGAQHGQLGGRDRGIGLAFAQALAQGVDLILRIVQHFLVQALGDPGGHVLVQLPMGLAQLARNALPGVGHALAHRRSHRLGRRWRRLDLLAHGHFAQLDDGVVQDLAQRVVVEILVRLAQRRAAVQQQVPDCFHGKASYSDWGRGSIVGVGAGPGLVQSLAQAGVAHRRVQHEHGRVVRRHGAACLAIAADLQGIPIERRAPRAWLQLVEVEGGRRVVLVEQHQRLLGERGMDRVAWGRVDALLADEVAIARVLGSPRSSSSCSRSERQPSDAMSMTKRYFTSLRSMRS